MPDVGLLLAVFGALVALLLAVVLAVSGPSVSACVVAVFCVASVLAVPVVLDAVLLVSAASLSAPDDAVGSVCLLERAFCASADKLIVSVVDDDEAVPVAVAEFFAV